MSDVKEYKVRVDQFVCGCETWETRHEHSDNIEIGGQEEIYCPECSAILEERREHYQEA